MIIRPPTSTEIPQILEMLTRAYVAHRPGFPNDPSHLGLYSVHDPGGGPENWVVLWEGDRPVSALRVFYRSVSFAGEELPVGGIGNVGTDPDAGGRGHATHVMNAVHDKLRIDGVATAVLVTDIPDFYERLGYGVVRQRELQGGVLLRPEDAGDLSDMAPLAPPIPARVRRWHDAGVRETDGRVIRSEIYWDMWVGRFRLERSEVAGVVSDQAYLIGRREDAGAAYRILEGGGDVDALKSLVVVVGDRATTLKTPDEPIFRRLFRRLDATATERSRTGIMAFPLTPDAPGPDAFEGFLEIDAF